MRLVVALALALVFASSALAAPNVTIYPKHPDPRLPLLVSAHGTTKDPQPYAGIACNGVQPKGDTELGLDPGAPLIWQFDPRDQCRGDSLTAGVFTPDGSEIARTTTTFAAPEGVVIVPYLTPRNYQYPLLRPAPARFFPGSRIDLEAAGLPPRRHFKAEIRLVGRRHQRGCKVRESVKQGRSNGDGVLTRGLIEGYPVPDELPFCRGRSYTVKFRDVSDDQLYGALTIKIRRSSGP